MSFELRWKQKQREVMVALHPGVMWSPERKLLETYEVLEYRSEGQISPEAGWQEVKRVDLNGDVSNA